MKIIPIKLPNKLASIPCFVDDEDYEMLSKFKWFCMGRGGGEKTYYVARHLKISEGATKDAQEFLFMHRALMSPPANLVVDHINGNGCDNRKENLRVVTQQQNVVNRTRLNSNNTSGVPGVSFLRKRQKWMAQVMRHRKHIYLGEFKSKEEAIASREKYLMAERDALEAAE